MKILKSTLSAAALALAASSANAAVISGDTVLVSIQKDGFTGDSMLIDTNVATTDFRDGIVTSWTSNTDLTAAISSFITGASQVQYYAIGSYSPAFDAWVLSAREFGDKTSIQAVEGNFNSFVTNANSGVFASATEGLSENWATDIPDGDDSEFDNNLLFGNGSVIATDMGTASPFYSNFAGFPLDPTVTQLSDWNLGTDGSLTYGAVVPVPAAVWLFGSGLLGLVGVARRRKA